MQSSIVAACTAYTINAGALRAPCILSSGVPYAWKQLGLLMEKL